MLGNLHWPYNKFYRATTLVKNRIIMLFYIIYIKYKTVVMTDISLGIRKSGLTYPKLFYLWRNIKNFT